MSLMFWNWLLFTGLASAAIGIALWRLFDQLPLTTSVSLWAIALGYAAMFLAQFLGIPDVGFGALLVATCVVMGSVARTLVVGPAFSEPASDPTSMVSVYDAINDEWEAWERVEAYRQRIETKSPEFIQRAMLIVVDKELRLMIDEQLAVYRSRRHINQVATA